MSQLNFAPVVSPVDVAELCRDIGMLPISACLLQHQDYKVFIARAREIPAVLQEIGRLREVSFRAAGEGTGRTIDLDVFDEYYQHLFIWHAARQEVVGAYRLGFSEEIIPDRGASGFYSWQLFDFGERFVEKMSPCIELGRSFVRAEDQKTFLALHLLWRGIALAVSREPQYRRLFGPVSISAAVPLAFRKLLAESLLKFHGADGEPLDVRSRRPLAAEAFTPDVMAGLADSNSLRDLLARLAPGLKMPVLLRQYLKLNGRLLAFSVDPDFNNALDGLIMVDLDQVAGATLARYMGADVARAFSKQQDLHMRPLLQANREILAAAAGVLDGIDDADYTRVMPGIASGTIGAHLRHILDHYSAILDRSDGVIDYERRRRESEMETCRQQALQEVRRMLLGLEGVQDEHIRIRSEASQSAQVVVNVGSTVSRELLFAGSHAIHHFAIIAVLMRAQGRDVSDDFGRAPSTLTYMRRMDSGQGVCA